MSNKIYVAAQFGILYQNCTVTMSVYAEYKITIILTLTTLTFIIWK